MHGMLRQHQIASRELDIVQAIHIYVRRPDLPREFYAIRYPWRFPVTFLDEEPGLRGESNDEDIVRSRHIQNLESRFPVRLPGSPDLRAGVFYQCR